jgi:MoaE-MoaD fusion protein
MAGCVRVSGEQMKLTVRLFAVLREQAGAESLQLTLPRAATVADALRALAEHPALRETLSRLKVVIAVNREYADPATPLRDDDELALIPPLSGGSGELDRPAAAQDAPRVHVRIGERPLSREDVRAAVSDPRAGAVVVFEGVTREVPLLDYEAYGEMARERIERIAREVVRAHGLCAAAAEHRLGEVALGEPSVIVAVSAAHREEAFAGAREAIDRIKAEAPIWKRELGGANEDGRAPSARWVEGTPAPIGAPSAPAARAPAATSESAPAHESGVTHESGLTHLGRDGSARMVDVGAKPASERVARARARVRMSPDSARAVQAGDGPKGEVLGVARIAGIQAAKQTAQLIPLAHPLALSFVDVAAGVDADAGVVELVGEARTVAGTGVEMEAMTACAVAALTIYDMVKGLERGIEIEQVVLLEKRGGRSGDYRRPQA